MLLCLRCDWFTEAIRGNRQSIAQVVITQEKYSGGYQIGQYWDVFDLFQVDQILVSVWSTFDIAEIKMPLTRKRRFESMTTFRTR